MKQALGTRKPRMKAATYIYSGTARTITQLCGRGQIGGRIKKPEDALRPV